MSIANYIIIENYNQIEIEIININYVLLTVT